MWNLLMALLLFTAVDLDTITQAAGNVPETIAVESQQQPLSPPNISANPPVTNNALDCSGQTSSTTSVSTLLSRLIRSSAVVRGVQCPLPPVPDKSTAQELHP